MANDPEFETQKLSPDTKIFQRIIDGHGFVEAAGAKNNLTDLSDSLRDYLGFTSSTGCEDEVVLRIKPLSKGRFHYWAYHPSSD